MLPSASNTRNESQSEDSWVDEFTKTYTLLVTVDRIDNDVHPCVFRILQNVIDTAPQAYTPQRIALGPYHHLRPEFRTLHWHKLAVIKNFLGPQKFKDFRLLVINILLEMEAAVRSCYAQFLDLKGHTLATIMAIDCVFLLHILHDHYNKGQIVDAAPEHVVKDLFMLENQIPAVLLKEVGEALNLSPTTHDWSFNKELFELCRIHSPLEVSVDHIFNDKCPHLLAFLHRLIVNYQIDDRPPVTTRMGLATMITGVIAIVNTATDTYGKVNKNMEDAETFVQKVVQYFKKPTKPVEEIEIPSVSQLQYSVKVKFVPTGKGIKHIKLMKEEDGSFQFYLPVITMNRYSEVILRNLVEYEKVMIASTDDPRSITTLVSDYVVLMCGILQTAKDVELLRQENIIVSSVSDEEITKIFNGMKKSTSANKKWRLKEKSAVEKAIEQSTKEYNKTLRAKASKFLKKYIYGSWKPIALISVLVTVVLLVLQAFCQLYGWCSATSVSIVETSLFGDVPKVFLSTY